MLNCARSAFKTHRRHRHHLLPRGMGESRAKNSGKDRGNIPIPFIYRNSCFSVSEEEETSRRERERDDSATTTSYGVGSWLGGCGMGSP